MERFMIPRLPGECRYTKEAVSYALLGYSETRGARLQLVFDDQKQFVFWEDKCSVVETVDLRNPQI